MPTAMTLRHPIPPAEPGAPFPHPVRSFAGRGAELERVLAHVDREVLYFVYGVGGIGKSELVYQIIHELRSRPRWREAVPLLVEVRPGATATRTLAGVLAATGASPEPRCGQPTEKEHLADQLAALARRLEERPYLLFIDDVHHLPGDLVAEALHVLARRVSRSRLFVASRRAIPLPADAPPPVITTLEPLDSRDAASMMDALVERMQIERPDPVELMRTTHGSPFHIRQMLVRHDGGTDAVSEAVAGLSTDARRVLAAASVAQSPVSVAALGAVWDGATPVDVLVRELEQQFLLEVGSDRVFVHDLVGEAVLGRASPDEVARAHDDCARMCAGRLATSGASVILAVDAVTHRIAAGQPEEAWGLVERWHSALAAAGNDHLLLEPLDRLRAALPSRGVALELLRARCLIRASLIGEAEAALAHVADQRTLREQARYDTLAGEIAQRRGDLTLAAGLFEAAAASAPDEGARFSARLQVATTAVFAGDGDGARAELDEALAELTAPTARQLARHAWVRTVSWMFGERYELAAREAQRARRRLEGTGLDDLACRLAMLETLAHIECDDMDAARIAARGIDAMGLRRTVAALYRAIVAYADGASREAADSLIASHERLRDQGDTINAYIAGYYGSVALAAIGRLLDAQELAARAAELGRSAAMPGPATQARAQQALLAAEAVQAPIAHRLADEVLSAEHVGPRSRAMAHCAHAHAYTIEGDISRALDQVALARAAVCAPDLTAAQASVDIEQAAVELIGGNLERAVELAERAVDHYAGRSREYEAARSRLVLAAAYIARGRRTDVLYAERTIAQARELARRGQLTGVLVGCAILTAALARRGQRDRAADEVLADALRELDPERGSIYASTLLAAIEGGAASWVVPGAVALLAHLGFSEAVGCYLVDQHGRRAATDKDVDRERNLRELFVDEARSVITARNGEVAIRGRAMQCALLSVLIQARGEPVPAAALYKRVWNVTEYHPLQHRNALYVAINRLRKCLRGALDGREVVERSSEGWRLAAGVDACVAVPARAAGE